ncbi:MAG: DNA-binding response regulator [Acidobacteria bacterium]|nr:MAG: DNA-binding response regulator [Acidobacteriota bacterium]PYS65291.1 MAG: DNA-binding response regulator [Acidobacteriota bacterium]
MNPTLVLIADDHALVRAGIRALLERIPNTEVVAEASDGREAMELIAKRQPDIVLMDIAMPGLNGLEATRQIVKTWPPVRVIILSMHSSEEYVWQALRAGARGYLLKGASLAELELALSFVVRGEIYLSPPLSQQVIREYVQRTGKQRAREETLTARQREILSLIAEGKSTKQVALQLNISVKTVESHRAQIMERLNIHDVAGLVRYAIRTGLVKIEQ